MRVLACVLALTALILAGRSGARSLGACPHSAGAVTYLKGGERHVVALSTCATTVAGRAGTRAAGDLRSPQGHLATIAVTRGAQTIEVDGKAVLRVREDHRQVPGGVPGPLGLVTWSPDGRWLFYFIDPQGSSSIAADGLRLRALNVATGKTFPLNAILIAHDYLTWCGSTLVLTTGEGRLATWNKRLVKATAPTWKPHVVWNAPGRAFGSVACAPDGKKVAVLSQRAQDKNWDFFATRWQLWRVGLDGAHTLLDEPPEGYADYSPRWSPDGRSLLFVRERKGYGSLEVLQNGHVYGPLAQLGYSLGYYGHNGWDVAWRR